MGAEQHTEGQAVGLILGQRGPGVFPAALSSLTSVDLYIF